VRRRQLDRLAAMPLSLFPATPQDVSSWRPGILKWTVACGTATTVNAKKTREMVLSKNPAAGLVRPGQRYRQQFPFGERHGMVPPLWCVPQLSRFVWHVTNGWCPAQVRVAKSRLSPDLSSGLMAGAGSPGAAGLVAGFHGPGVCPS
jgi:hypothetical protein